MDFETIKAWFTRWVEREAYHCRLKGIIGLVLGPIALLVSLTIVYWLARLFTHDPHNNLGDPGKCFWTTLAILPLLFILNRLTPRRNLMEERMAEGPEDSLAGHYAARRQTMFYFFLWIMFTGPRLFDWAIDSFRESKRLKQIEVHGCAAVLWKLLSSPRKVSLDDLKRDMDWLDLPVVLPEIRGLPGVLFLKAAPPGLSLTPELRESILGDLRKRQAQTA